MKIRNTTAVLALALAMAGCSNYQEVPAGYVLKILTPNGWAHDIHDPGYVDLGSSQGQISNKPILLEVSSEAVKESFIREGDNNEDHRIIINNTPVTVDVYVRMAVPTDSSKRNAIFAQITPLYDSNYKVGVIKVTTIYDKFARADVRSAIRALFQKQKALTYIESHLESYNDTLAGSVKTMLERSGCPLILQNVVISNIKQDVSVTDAANRQAAAQAEVAGIEAIGKALRDNPGYVQYKKYETYEKIVGKGAQFTVIDGAVPTSYSINK